MPNGPATVENSIVVPQKIKNRITIWSSHSTSGYVPKRVENRDSERYLYTHIHSSIIHNSQKVEATQVSIDGWMDKQTTKEQKIYIYNNYYYYSTSKRKEIS